MLDYFQYKYHKPLQEDYTDPVMIQEQLMLKLMYLSVDIFCGNSITCNHVLSYRHLKDIKYYPDLFKGDSSVTSGCGEFPTLVLCWRPSLKPCLEDVMMRSHEL